MDNMHNNELWETARRRAGFKKSLTSYLLVNTFLIGIWYFTTGGNSQHFWPIWPILGWGLGLAFQYANAYMGTQIFSAEKEYEKLKNQQP
jgi:2TM domain